MGTLHPDMESFLNFQKTGAVPNMPYRGDIIDEEVVQKGKLEFFRFKFKDYMAEGMYYVIVENNIVIDLRFDFDPDEYLWSEVYPDSYYYQTFDKIVSTLRFID